MRYNIGQNVYVKYKGVDNYGEVTGYEFPYYIVTLSNGLQLSFYEDELEST